MAKAVAVTITDDNGNEKHRAYSAVTPITAQETTKRVTAFLEAWL